MFKLAEEHGIDAVEVYAADVGVVSKRIKKLEVVANEKKDLEASLEASAELAIAYLDGDGCPKDKEKAFRYAKNLLFEDEDFGLIGTIADRANSDSDAKDVLMRLNDMACELEKTLGYNYEEPTMRSCELNIHAEDEDWQYPNGHDDGEAPDTGI